MIAMKEQLSQELIRTFAEKSSKLVLKPLTQIQRLFGFEYYFIVPLFQYPMCAAYHDDAIKSYLISNGCRIYETMN